MTLALLWLLGPGPIWVAHATAFTVDNSSDAVDDVHGDNVCHISGGGCTLRAAIQEANANGQDDTITLGTGTYTLTLTGADSSTGDLDITASDALTITGVGPDQTIIHANGIDRVFEIHSGAGTVVISGVTIISGTVTGNGGGIYNHNADLVLINTIVSSNIATGTYASGGGVFVLSGTLTLSGGQILSNTVTSDGGGVYVSESIATFTQTGASTIAHNRSISSGNGGGVYVHSGRATLSGGQILDNSADDGGGVYIYSGTVTLNGGHILSNTANTSGGGVYLNQNNATFTQSDDSTIAYNSASNGSGGGVYVRSGTATLSGGQILNNTADTAHSGGGVYVDQSTATFVQTGISTVTQNFAGYGGGVYVRSGQATLTGGQILSNSAHHDGGGVFVNESSATFTQTGASTIAHNTATSNGGGVFVYAGTATLSGGQILDNSADDGGGVCVYTTTATLTLSEGLVVSNTAGTRGGGIFNDSGTLTLVNTTVGQNTATVGTGGGFHNIGGTAMLTHTTVASNTAASGGNGIQTEGGTVHLRNTLVAHNGITNCNVGLTSDGYNLEDDTTCGLAGAGDQQSTDPLLGPLADNGGDTQTYALLSGSPAIDAAGCLGGVTTDQRGIPRPQGSQCDIGAYEVEQAELSLAKTVDDGTPDPGQLITYTITVDNSGALTATNGLISDTLPNDLTFAGPVTLDPPGAGTTGTPPTLASGLTIAGGGRITLTFPVTVNTGLAGGTVRTNTAAVTSTEVTTPQTGAVGVTINNVTPVASDATLSTDEDTPLPSTLSADDANDDSLTYGIFTGPVSGTVTITDTDTGGFVYTPTNRISGYADSFTYIVSDTGGLTDTGTVTVTVTADNDAPTASDDTVSTDEDTNATGTISASDPDTDDTLTYSITSGPTYGSASINGTTGAWVYTPTNRTADYTDAFTVTVTDSGNLTDTATVTVNVDADADNNAPTISNIVNQSTYVNTPRGPIAFTIGDVETSAADLTLSAGSSNTTLVPISNIIFGGSGANRTVTITPAANQTGTTTITITVDDGTDTADDTFVLTVMLRRIYLPLICKNQ